VDVRSSPGEGATFTLEIPVDQPITEVLDAAAPDVSEEAAAR
jgi:hypothetical protein